MDAAASSFLVPLLQIIWIDVVLSDDNALVIAMACRSLPKKERRLAIALGAGAAALLRIVFTLLALQVLAVPFIRLAGGAVLLWIAIRLAGDQEEVEDAPAPASIWASIRIIVVADAVMSLDNVIAIAAAAQGSAALIVFGLALSIPLVVFGANLLAPLLKRFPVLVWGGGAILGWVAGDLIGSDPAVSSFLRVHAPMIGPWALPAAGAALALIGSWVRLRVRKAGARPRKTPPKSP
jgi:YjbE family integral membrane protein